MSELQSTTVSEIANSNNAASPNGMPEGMAPSGVNDAWREGWAALVRWYNRVHGLDNTRALLSSAGSGTTRTLTFTTAPASLFTGLTAAFKAGSDFDAASTLNVNGLGAKNIQKMTTAGLANIVAGDIKSGQHVTVKYDGTADKWIMLTPSATAETAFADPMTTRGDIIIRNSSNVTARLAIGAAARLLRSDGTDISWAQLAGATDISGTIPSGNLPAATTSASGVSQLADAAAMEAATTGRVPTADIQHRHPGHPKANLSWNFASILTDYGVTSVADNGAGLWTPTFDTAFSTANNYLNVHGHLDASGNATGHYAKQISKTTTTCAHRFNVNGAATDVDQVHTAYHGDQ